MPQRQTVGDHLHPAIVQRIELCKVQTSCLPAHLGCRALQRKASLPQHPHPGASCSMMAKLVKSVATSGRSIAPPFHLGNKLMCAETSIALDTKTCGNLCYSSCNLDKLFSHLRLRIGLDKLFLHLRLRIGKGCALQLLPQQLPLNLRTSLVKHSSPHMFRSKLEGSKALMALSN